MAIAAQRNEIKDGETSSAIIDLSKVDSGSVSNAETKPTQSTESDTGVISGGPTKNDRTLKNSKKKKKENDLLKTIKKTAKPKLSSSVIKKDVVRRAKQSLGNALVKEHLQDMPKLLRDTRDVFKTGDVDDIANSINDFTHAGLKYYCLKTGRMKTRTGLGLNGSLLAGYIGRRSMDLMDELCLAIETGELDGSNTVRALEIITKWSYDNSVLGREGSILAMSNLAIASKITSALPFGAITDPDFPEESDGPLLTVSQFANKIRDGEFDSALENLQTYEIDHLSKLDYDAELVDRITTIESGTAYENTSSPEYKQYKNYLLGRGRLKKLVAVRSKRIHYKNKYSNYKDNMGRMFRSLLISDISNLTFPGMTEGHRQIVEYLKKAKEYLSEDPDFVTRDNSYGSFDDYDFSVIMPENLLDNYRGEEVVVRDHDTGKVYELVWDPDEPNEYTLTSENVEVVETIPHYQPMIDLIGSSDAVQPTYLVNDLDVTTCIGMGFYD